MNSKTQRIFMLVQLLHMELKCCIDILKQFSRPLEWVATSLNPSTLRDNDMPKWVHQPRDEPFCWGMLVTREAIHGTWQEVNGKS